MKSHDIVTIGNGTGQGVILQAIRKLTDLDRVAALVGVTDNGGHSGALRRDMHVPSMGDVKTVIAALTGETVWGQIVRHRFRGGRLNGVSMGNLLLAALMDESGSLYHATHRLCQALEIKANILPISETDSQVVAELEDGSEVVGEWETINRPNREKHIVGIHHQPALETNPQALRALENANWIVICPGTLWLGIGSILAASGVKEITSKCTATIIAVGNMLNQPGVTDGLTAKDHLRIIQKLLGRNVDYYLIHDQEIPENILKIYEEKGFTMVKDDLKDNGAQVVRGDLINHTHMQSIDRVHYDESRGFPHALRHDPSMLARILLHISEAKPLAEEFASKPKVERWEVKDF
jgi:uncharacterized cofD-like protein